MLTEKTIKWAIARFIITIVIAVGLIVWITVREGNVSRELEQGLIANCETNGNKLRIAVQHIYQEDLKNTFNEALLKKVFPEVPEPTFKELVQESRERDERIIKEIAPVDCSEQYKK